MGGVSNPRPLAEPSCLGTRFDPETGTEIEEPGDSSMSSAVVGAGSTILSGEILVLKKYDTVSTKRR